MFPTLKNATQKPLVLSLGWLLFFGGLAGLSYWNDHRTTDAELTRAKLRQASFASEKKLPKYETKPIGEIRPIVDWVLADNPEITEDREYVDDTRRYITDFGPLDPPNWRIVHFRLKKDDGSDLNMWLGRPLWYFEELAAVEDGARVWMDIAEFGAFGNADVISIAQCPQPPPRPSNRHHLVTGRFVHSSSEFLRLTIERLDEPIDATANHPFWSEDRQAFVEAGDLIEGERFRRADNSTLTLAAISRKDERSQAFNLEVAGQHVFHVSEAGILAHNACLVLDDLSGLRVRSLNSLKPQRHHIASKYDNRMKDMFKIAKLDIDSAFNKVKLSGHQGPHGWYNDYVYGRLTKAVSGKTGAAYRSALIDELLDFRWELRNTDLGDLVRASSP